jgi:hypothetical protein
MSTLEEVQKPIEVMGVFEDSKKCEIRKEGSDKLVEETIRNPNNIYMLNEIRKERCCLGKENESWI